MKKPNIISEETYVSEAKGEKGEVLYYAIDVIKDDQEVASFHPNGYIPLTLDQAKNNAKICSTALNLTNKGFNIESIEEMYEALSEIRKTIFDFVYISNLPEQDKIRIEKAKQALKNAKYEE